ncbi:unnamed protein product [Sphenostylis stenocarpa]|uniref:Uncharacterized protein n=1 Tax=Sphenostylis stenocarpa TaxID=92480 RepID=A0AA86T7C1_9FABA|nr:unnamed protein product [Sphenostylis stenocarpa]
MSASEAEKKVEEEKEEVKGGELLFCGATGWDIIGRRRGAIDGNLVSPSRLRPLVGVNIRFVASGCVCYVGENAVSCHCVALDVEGRCYTWGRNEKGQLGHGDMIQRDRPTVVSELSKIYAQFSVGYGIRLGSGVVDDCVAVLWKNAMCTTIVYKIVKAGAGRSHTVVVTEDGNSLAFGWNKHGQLGSGSVRNEIESSPVRCLVSEVKHTACGGDFTVWLSSIEGVSILTGGLPQYGQLGHGTDNEYNSKDSSVKLVYEPQPRPRAIAALAGETIVKVACGTNHTVAVDKNGFVYTWGFGGYGRLGHREQKDEWVPRRVDVFQNRNLLPPDAIISAGAVSSSCTAGGGQLYMWGKLKNTGDDWMYPKPLMDLSGWNIRCMDSGNMHHFVGADSSCISWGHAQNGELGYGPAGQKSSAVPKKVDILEGMHVISVACGMGHSMVIVDRANVADRLDQLDIYDGKAVGEGNEAVNITPVPKQAAKKGAKAADNSKKRKKSKDSSESEEEEDAEESEDSEEDEINGEAEVKRSRGSGRGRGKASKTSGAKGKGSAAKGKGSAAKEKGGGGQGRGGTSANKNSSKSPQKKHKRGLCGHEFTRLLAKEDNVKQRWKVIGFRYRYPSVEDDLNKNSVWFSLVKQYQFVAFRPCISPVSMHLGSCYAQSCWALIWFLNACTCANTTALTKAMVKEQDFNSGLSKKTKYGPNKLREEQNRDSVAESSTFQSRFENGVACANHRVRPKIENPFLIWYVKEKGDEVMQRETERGLQGKNIRQI